jgi:uncharacterized NAD(P)/FAD-binding protein YdhS
MVSSPVRVLVVGGGAAGAITAVAVLRQAAAYPERPVQVMVVERSAVVGPGLAYGTQESHHLLNNYASRMSAVEDDPQHLVRWCLERGMRITPGTFLARRTYGRYLADLLDNEPIPIGSGLTRQQGEVVDIVDTGTTYRATTASGAVLSADVVVLALGNPPPRMPRSVAVDESRLLPDPWSPDLLDRVGDGDRVLLVGTGLTAVDVAAQISCARPAAHLTAMSRHGLLPLRHLPEPPSPAPSFDGDVRSLRAVLAEVRRCLGAGADWRCLVESLKLVANDVWAALPGDDREQFARHVRRHWEVARHRMAPAMADVIDDLLAGGRLTLAVPAEVDPASYDVVVNCTGPAPVTTPGWSRLVDNLAVKGMLWPGPFGLGIDIDSDGALLDADGVAARGMYAVGAARRGVEWEVAAVPDIRRQALRLARHLDAVSAEPPASLVG